VTGKMLFLCLFLFFRQSFLFHARILLFIVKLFCLVHGIVHGEGFLLSLIFFPRKVIFCLVGLACGEVPKFFGWVELFCTAEEQLFN
jgi:hypothetical protein